jgi:hypothetical protein
MKRITITVEYKLSNSAEYCEVELEPEEYFDLELNEKAEWDSVPKFNDTLDYLNIDKEKVQYIKTTIMDQETNTNLCFVDTFWNQGENRIIEKTISGSRSYWEMIICTKLLESSFTWELLRFHKENNIPTLSYHGLFKDNEDGSEEELIIYRVSKES